MHSQRFKILCQEILKEGRKLLKLETGVISKFRGDQYEIIAVESKANVFVAGESFSLSNTVCAYVAERKATVTITKSSKDAQDLLHPLYVPTSLKTYIGSPIFLNENIWGSINFTSLAARTEPFSIDQIDSIEKYAARISATLQDE